MGDSGGLLYEEECPLKEALLEIEGLSTDDFMKGGFLCKELPADYRDLWIMKTKEIARKALELTESDNQS